MTIHTFLTETEEVAMKQSNLQIPRIALTIIEKNGKTYHLRPSIRKTRKMIRTSLKSKFKNGFKVRLKVVYGKAETAQRKIEVFDNRAEPNTLTELHKVFEAFIDKGLWLPLTEDD